MSAAIDRFLLDGRLVLVTGASSGLGTHFAQLLAGAGARVALAARRTDKLQSVVDAITQAGGQARAYSLDVTSAASVRECLDAIAAWGVPDVVVNNAGVTVTRPLLEQTEEDFDHVLDTNLKGCWLVATEAARRMVAAGQGGAIVNVASILGERVAGGVAPYAISKAAVVQATKAMALEWGRYGINVNALCPGYIDTEINHHHWQTEQGQKLVSMLPRKRVGQPQDLDALIVMLASDQSHFINGSVIAADDGFAL